MYILKMKFSFEAVSIKVTYFMKIKRKVEVSDGKKKNMLSFWWNLVGKC